MTLLEIRNPDGALAKSGTPAAFIAARIWANAGKFRDETRGDRPLSFKERGAARGVRLIQEREPRLAALDASLLRMDDDGPTYLVYNNFRVLMAWNRSTYFALTVGELADLIEHG